MVPQVVPDDTANHAANHGSNHSNCRTVGPALAARVPAARVLAARVLAADDASRDDDDTADGTWRRAVFRPEPNDTSRITDGDLMHTWPKTRNGKPAVSIRDRLHDRRAVVVDRYRLTSLRGPSVVQDLTDSRTRLCQHDFAGQLRVAGC